MLGMMNCNNDAVEFYAASPSSQRNSLDKETAKIFVEHKEKKKVSYTEDGKKMIDGKIVESSDDEASHSLTPEQMWNRLITTSAMNHNMNHTQDSKELSSNIKK